jgi:hypothetical protein
MISSATRSSYNNEHRTHAQALGTTARHDKELSDLLGYNNASKPFPQVCSNVHTIRPRVIFHRHTSDHRGLPSESRLQLNRLQCNFGVAVHVRQG